LSRLECEKEAQLCMFCQKDHSEHSDKLWNMHALAIEEGIYCSEHSKKEKLYPIRIGFGPKTIARVCNTGMMPPHDVEIIPIYMSCTGCGLSLGRTEESNADLLDGMCLKCFRELTNQTAYWYDMPPATRIIKEGVRIWQYRDSKGKWHQMYGNFVDSNIEVSE